MYSTTSTNSDKININELMNDNRLYTIPEGTTEFFSTTKILRSTSNKAKIGVDVCSLPENLNSVNIDRN